MNNTRRYSAVVLVLALVVGVPAALLLPTRESLVTVTGHDWRREIQVENYVPRHYTDWNDYMPSDAYSVSCWTAQRSTRQEYAGQDCHTDSDGDRTCTSRYRSVPVYDTKCSWTADRWGYERSLITTGAARSERPSWATLDFTPCDALECEREGQHNELYQVYFRGDGDSFPCPVNEALWGEYRVGDEYTMQIGALVHIPRCETVKAQP